MREKILELLDSLRFKGMAQILDQELDRAEREGTAAVSYTHLTLPTICSV